MPKFLGCYPFADERVRLVEGYTEYVGVLHDKPGDPHLGIDYVLLTGPDAPVIDKENPLLTPLILGNGLQAEGFEVFAMHGGFAYQGVSDSWGNFVAVTWHGSNSGPCCRTIYAHLHSVERSIPTLPERKKSPYFLGQPITCGTYLGRAGDTGATGDTEKIIQLHIELLDLSGPGGKWERNDPYGVFASIKTKPYPQPGDSLESLQLHRWVTDRPPLATSTRGK